MLYTTLILLCFLSGTAHTMDVATADSHYTSLTEKLGYRPSSLTIFAHHTKNQILKNIDVPTILSTEFEVPSISIMPFLRPHFEEMHPYISANYLSGEIICYDRHTERNSPTDIASGIIVLDHLRMLGVKKITRHSIGKNVTTVLHELNMLAHDEQATLQKIGITQQDRTELLKMYSGGIVFENPQFDETDYAQESVGRIKQTLAYIPGASYIKQGYAYYMGYTQEPLPVPKLNSLDLLKKLTCLKEMPTDPQDESSLLSFLVTTFNGTSDDHAKNLKHITAMPLKTYWIPSSKTESEQTYLTCDGPIVAPDENQINAMNAYRELQKAAYHESTLGNGTSLIRMAEEYYNYDSLKQYQSIIYGLSSGKFSQNAI